MPNFYTRNLRQTVTYWGNPTPDGWGGYTFDSPVQIIGRWEGRMEMFVTADGKEVRSQAVVFVAQDLDVDGYVYLGTSAEANPKNQEGALRIRTFKKTPGIKANKFVRVAWA
jgi:hypothetical protein